MKQKKNKQYTSNTQPTAAGSAGTSLAKPPFFRFIREAENKKFLWAAFIIGIVYFIILRILYPIPLFYPDSFTYIEVARDHQVASFRPIQYSQIINFFKSFSDSDVALIFGQYFSNLLANLFLFFTCIYFFPFRRFNRLLLFVLLAGNPLYLFYSNFVLTDSLFAAFTVAWFAFLIWILYKPKWYYTAFQLLLLLLLFKLRYNAIIFPAFISVAILLSKQAMWKKVLSIALNIAVIAVLIFNVIDDTETFTGTRTFSAFAGWQMANNAMYVLRDERDIDTSSIDNPDVNDVLRFTKNYLDTSKAVYDTVNITGVYMWNPGSPLKKYINIYARKNFYSGYLDTWTALGPVYNEFGKTIILQKPMSYIRNFVLPNAKDYFLPPFEAYEEYRTKPDTLQKIVTEFYKYRNNRSGAVFPWVYNVVIAPWYYLFPLINILFIIVSLGYFITKKFKTMPVLFNRTLLCFSMFYVANFFFVVLLAPTIFRYHVFIVTLILPLLVWCLQQMIRPLQQTEK